MRDFDDKLIYALNNSLPTASIKARTESNAASSCQSIFETLSSSYSSRGKVLQACILQTADQVVKLKKDRENSNDINIDKKFKSEQRKVRS